MIALNSPLKPDLKKLGKYLEKINESGWFTNFGPLQLELQEKLSEYLSVENLLLVSNGTVALQVAGNALHCNHVLTTPFSFVATASAFLWQNKKVDFADIERNSCNLSAVEVEHAIAQGSRADTIVATHVYGNVCDDSALKDVAEKYNKKVIYDAAHAFGVKVNGDSALTLGDASTISFHATKLFHTVEGGAITFKSSDAYERAKELINFGLSASADITDVGINAKMNEYQAAVGLVNLNSIDNVMAHRAELFEYYRTQLKDVVSMPIWHPDASFNGAYMPIILESELQCTKLMNHLSESSIQSRRYFSPSLNNAFPDCKNYNTKISENLSSRILCLPLHAMMTFSDVDSVVNKVKWSQK